MHQKEYGASVNEQSKQQEGEYSSDHLCRDENLDVDSKPQVDSNTIEKAS